MKTTRLYLLTVLVFFPVLLLQGQINVITYNIRFNNPGDGEFAWPNRKSDVISLLKFHKADVFCLQEALEDQVLDLDSAFSDFAFAGVGRDDGARKGEYAPVFIDTTKFTLESKGHFWLCEDPRFPELGWDAACVRICTWVSLSDKRSGQAFKVFNTHFDHVGDAARQNSAELIIRKIKELATGDPVILCGDLNLPPESLPIKSISAFLNDAYDVSELPPHGPRGTWSGFTYDSTPGDRIDYIFVSRQFRVKRYAILSDSKDQHYFSDHLPVFVELEIE